MDVEKIRKRVGRELTTKQLFLSQAMNDFISNRLFVAVKDFFIPKPNLRLMYDESENSPVAFTDNYQIVVNPGHEIFQGDDQTKFSLIQGVSLHEVGHILFTNFSASEAYLKAIENGTMWPKMPDVEPELEENLDSLMDAISEPKLAKVIAYYIHQLWNCLEDGRMENLVMYNVQNANSLLRGLRRMRIRTHNSTRTVDEEMELIEENENYFVGSILNQCCYRGRFCSWNGKPDPDTEFGKVLLSIEEFVDKYCLTVSAIDAINELNKIVIVIIPYILKMIESQEQQSGDGDGDETGNGNGQSSAGSPSSKSCPGSGSGSSPSASDIQDMLNNMSDSELEDLLNNIAKQIQDELQNQTNDNSQSQTGEGSDSRQNQRKSLSIGKPTDSNSKDDNQNNSESSPSASDDSDDEKEEQAEKNSLRKLKDEVADELTEDAINDALEEDYEKVQENAKAGNLNAEASSRVQIKQIPTNASEQLLQIEERAKKLAKIMAKKSDYLDTDDAPTMVTGLYAGTKFNAKDVSKANYRTFSKKRNIDYEPEIAVGVLIDESGSMGGSKTEIAKFFSLVLYYYVQELRDRSGVDIPLNIYGHTSRGYGSEIFLYTDAAHESSKDALRLMGISSYACNRDGLALRIVKERLEEEYPEQKKLIFLISDGLPSAYSSHEEAEKDLAEITADCERQGIGLVCAAIDGDKEKIESLYGSKHFLDITDTDKLPTLLIKRIKNLL